MEKQLKNEHRFNSITRTANMGFSVKFMIIIYISVFILAKLFYCIDVNSEISTITTDDTTIESANSSDDATNTIPSDQSPTIQPQENGNPMQICNQSFPIPKGTVCCVCTILDSAVVCTVFY